MTTQRKPARRYASESEVKRTNAVETAAKLTQLTDRARRTGAAQGPLVPVEALMTIESDAWVWQTVDRKNPRKTQPPSGATDRGWTPSRTLHDQRN